MRAFVFAIIILALSFLIYVYPLGVLSHLLFARDIFGVVTLIPTVITAMTVWVYFRTHMKSPLLSLPIYYGMGMGFIGFWVVNIGLLAALALPEFTFEIGLICLLFAVIACVKAIVNGHQIQLENIQITSAKIKRHYSLVFISDVHLGSNPTRHLEKICTRIDMLDYDALLIGGDLFDSSAFQANDLAPLRAIRKPILFVTGNHEYYVKDHTNKIAGLTDHNITILDNQTIQLEGLNIIGISDNQSPKRQLEIAITQLESTQLEGAQLEGATSAPSRFNLLMVHQPSIWKDVPDSVDLMLSGHTHNGQIFPFRLLVRLQFKNVYGIYKRLSSTLYVSSGSGTWGPRMRLGTRNEIVHIQISPQK